MQNNSDRSCTIDSVHEVYKPCERNFTRLFAAWEYFCPAARKLVEGEDMKIRSETYQRKGLPVYGLFLAGFLIGVLLPNFMWRFEWSQKTTASMYLLTAFSDRALEKKEYFFYVLKTRGSLFLIASLCGVSVFGVPLAVIGMLYMGLQAGMLLTLSVLQFGLQGGLIGAGAMFPQYLLYFPCFFYLLNLVYVQSLEIWKNRGLLLPDVSDYFLRVIICACIFAGGMLLETWCNPPVMEILMKGLKLF